MSVAGAVASNTTVAHTIQLTNDSSGLLSFTGGIDQRNTGVLTLTKTGTGPVSVSGSGTYAGSVSITTGTFNANSATALGSDASSVSVTSGATLSLGAAPNYSTRSLAVSGTGVSSTVGALVINNTGTSAFQSITLGGPTYIRAVAAGSSCGGAAGADSSASAPPPLHMGPPKKAHSAEIHSRVGGAPAAAPAAALAPPPAGGAHRTHPRPRHATGSAAATSAGSASRVSRITLEQPLMGGDVRALHSPKGSASGGASARQGRGASSARARKTTRRASVPVTKARKNGLRLSVCV